MRKLTSDASTFSGTPVVRENVLSALIAGPAGATDWSAAISHFPLLGQLTGHRTTGIRITFTSMFSLTSRNTDLDQGNLLVRSTAEIITSA
jgi:hypothetical protein